MATDDKGNYGTPISYAIPSEDNEITFTDPFGFVLSVKGKQPWNVKLTSFACIICRQTFQTKVLHPN